MKNNSANVTKDTMWHFLIDGGQKANVEALKEAVYNGVTSLRYIEKILYDWRKKGYKSKLDVIEAKNKYRENSKKESKDVFYYDWLNDD